MSRLTWVSRWAPYKPVLAVLVLAVLLALFAVQWVAERHAAAAQVVQDAEPRVARWLGLIAAQPELEQTYAQLQAQRAHWAYPAERAAADLGNQLQEQMRTLANQAGLEVSGSQVLSPRAGEHTQTIAVQLNVVGTLGQLRALLAQLPAQSPRLALDALQVQGPGQEVSFDPQLVMSVTVAVLQERP